MRPVSSVCPAPLSDIVIGDYLIDYYSYPTFIALELPFAMLPSDIDHLKLYFSFKIFLKQLHWLQIDNEDIHPRPLLGLCDWGS